MGRGMGDAMNYLKEHKEKVMVGAAFLFCFLFSCYKLTAAPLWYDETIEFYFSRYLTGPIENVTGLQNLYERIVYYSFQPPLYHLLLSVWLLVSETEWWYRFSCVIFGVVSAAGLYKAVGYKTNKRLASFSVVIYPLIYEIMYYFRECAEYALLLACLTWTLYFFFKAVEEGGTKNLILFTVICVVDMYSQYGAAFVVVPLALIVLVDRWFKNKKELKPLLLSYVIAVVGAGLPLYWFFVRVQMGVQAKAGVGMDRIITFLNGNVVYDFFKNLTHVFGWSLIDSYSVERFELLMFLFLAGIFVLSLFVIVCSKNVTLKYLFLTNIISWIAYYVLVKMNLYAYAQFANRYSVFFVPIWLCTLILTAWESMRLAKERFGKKWIARGLGVAFLLVTLFVVAINLRKMPHIFEKSHTREAVDVWYEQEGYNTFTYVCFGENVSFEYYLSHNEKFKEEYRDNLYMEYGDEVTDTSEKSKEEYVALVKELCGGQLPDEMYVSTGNRFVIIEAMKQEGYEVEIVYQTNTTLCRLYR